VQPSQDYNNGVFFLHNVNAFSISLNIDEHSHLDRVDYPRANTLDYYITHAFNESFTVWCENAACPSRKLPGGGRKHHITKITSAPEYLILRLTTLQNKPLTGLYEQGDTPAGFRVPGRLDIAKHCSWNPSTYRYKLSSIVVHRGDSFESGHYFGFFTAPGSSRYVSDATVEDVTLTQFRARFMTSRKDLPYIVVYKRV
jgi:ubiquitin C-terminal hydrolase